MKLLLQQQFSGQRGFSNSSLDSLAHIVSSLASTESIGTKMLMTQEGNEKEKMDSKWAIKLLTGKQHARSHGKLRAAFFFLCVVTINRRFFVTTFNYQTCSINTGCFLITSLATLVFSHNTSGLWLEMPQADFRKSKASVVDSSSFYSS